MRETDSLAVSLIDRAREARVNTNLIAAFTKASPITVRDWLRKDQPPRGERLNRLQHMLSALGISSPELDYVTSYGRYLGRLMAFGIITLAEAQTYANTYQQGVFETIRGKRDPYAEGVPTRPFKSLEELQDAYDEQLQEAENKLRERYKALGGVPNKELEDGEETDFIAESPQTEPSLPRDLLIVGIASTAAGLMPQLRWLLEEATPAERHYFRTLMGEDGTFDMSNLLMQLCSERARDHQGR